MLRFRLETALGVRSDSGSPFHAVLRNLRMVMSGQAAIAAMGFLALTLNSRSLGLAGLGILFLVQAACELIAKVLSFQNWQTMVKFGAEALKDQDPSRLRAAWRYGFILDLLAATAAALIAGSLLLWTPGLIGVDPEYGKLGLIYAASLLLSESGTSVGALRILERFSVVVAINVASAALLLVNAVVLWAVSAPLWVYLVSIPIIAGGMSVLLIIAGYLRIERVAAGMRNTLRSTPFDRRRFLRFALGVSATGTLNTLRQRGEILVVGALLGPAASALYGVAYRVASLMARVGEAGRQSVYPVLGKLVADRKLTEAAALSFRFFRLGLLVAVPGIAVIFAMGGDILQLLFGEKFVAAAPNLLLLSIGTAFYVVSFAIGSLVQIELGSGSFLKLNLVAFFLGFVPLTVLGPLLLGQPGAGLGAAAFSVLLTILSVRQLIIHIRQIGEERA